MNQSARARATCRPRRFRTPLSRRIRLTRVDEELVRYLVYLGFAPMQALYLLGHLFRRDASKRKRQGLSGFARRCTTLFHAGILSRFDPAFSRYVRGGRSFLYCVESGRAAAAASTGKHYAALTDAEWTRIIEETSSLRSDLLALLERLGFAPEFAEARLDGTARMACRFYSGVTSTLPHTLIAATWLSIVWYGILARGWTLDLIQPDSVADLSFSQAGKRIAIQPDTLFVTRGHAIALEAETGQSPRWKIEQKVAHYLAFASAHDPAAIASRLGAERIDRFTVAFHCGSGAHALRVAEAIARACPDGTDLFAITADELSLERGPHGQALSRADFLTNAVIDPRGLRLYDWFASRIASPLFAQVEGVEDGAPVLSCRPLFENGASR